MKISNTMTGRKEEFIPLERNTVKMYVCGVTPYAEAHVGHAMSYVIFDVIRRYLEFSGYYVKHVQNFTDIDDKIIARAQKAGVSADELAGAYIAEYFADMDALNIKRADVYPRATLEIDKIIEIVTGLIEKGHAYVAGGDVYFSILSDPDYGELSHRSLDSMQAGARIEIGEDKHHPMDFALWKGAKPGEPSWSSPWGDGRPGWHIECSAMSLKYLGETMDIHGGGQDLIFPHHENELAQSESFTGVKPFVKYWLHNGLLKLGDEKMSKSLGNLVSIKDVLDEYGSDALRLFILSSHYRSPITFTEEVLASMKRGVERLRHAARALVLAGEKESFNPQVFRDRFVAAMDDDFNTPQAVASLFDLAREINRAREAGQPAARAQKALLEMSEVLGLCLEMGVEDHLAAKPFVELLINTRQDLRTAKQYTLADNIRQRLIELGIVLEDTPQGTVWHRKG